MRAKANVAVMNIRSRYMLRIAYAAVLGAALAAWFAFGVSSAVFGQDPGSYSTATVNPAYDIRPEQNQPADDSKEAASAARKQLADRRTARKGVEDMVAGVLRGASPLDPVKAEFDKWFNEVIFAEMAQADDGSLARTAELRENFFRSISKNDVNPAVRRHVIVDLAWPYFRTVVTENYHPAAKVNAVLTIGRLDAVQGIRQGTAPQPLPEALPFLVSILQDANQPDSMKIVALTGIVRHAEIDGQRDAGRLAADVRGNVTTELLKLLGPKPDTQDENTYYWLKRNAVRALGGFREPGAAGEVADALYAVLNDDSNKVTVLVDAATAYAGLKFTAPANAKVVEAVARVGTIAAKQARADLDYLDATAKQIEEISAYKGTVPGADPTGGTGGGGPRSGLSGAGAGGAGGNSQGADLNAGSPMGNTGGRNNTQSKPPAGSMPGMGGIPGMGGFGGQQAQNALPKYRLEISQRRLLTVLMGLKSAINDPNVGLKRLNVEPAKVDQVAKKIDELYTTAQVGLVEREKPTFDSRLKDFKTKVDRAAKALETTVDEVSPKTVEAPVEPAATPAADAFPKTP